jgi:HD-GYP domain-containing protein (c-di-GMP phosphodiesterase class II)
MRDPIHVELWNLAAPLVKTFDMMSPAVGGHSLRVGYLALRLAEELGRPAAERRDLALAGLLHDVGAFSLGERLDMLEFEDRSPGQHASAGALLLRSFPLFAPLSPLVEFHHLPWGHGDGGNCRGVAVPEGAHLLHLADRVAVLLDVGAPMLGQLPRICETIAEDDGERFIPAHVEALGRLGRRDFVWLDIASASMEPALHAAISGGGFDLDLDGLLGFARFLCRIIDFKSEFTATHSSGVAAAGRELARLGGFSPTECVRFEIAAYLHDLGKMAVPLEVLEKHGKLDAAEWGVMRTHVYYTHQVLSPITALGELVAWGGLHQERLDGSGYPFGIGADEIPFGARIMAVADVFTGITEDRPYRAGMPEAEAVRVLQGMAARNELDAKIVGLLLANFEKINRAREEAQARAVREYEDFNEALRRGPEPPPG